MRDVGRRFDGDGHHRAADGRIAARDVHPADPEGRRLRQAPFDAHEIARGRRQQRRAVDEPRIAASRRQLHFQHPVARAAAKIELVVRARQICLPPFVARRIFLLGLEHRLQARGAGSARIRPAPTIEYVKPAAGSILGDRFHPRRFLQLGARRFQPAPRLIRHGWLFDVGEETLDRDVLRRRRRTGRRWRPRQTLDGKADQAPKREENCGAATSYSTDHTAMCVPSDGASQRRWRRQGERQ